MSQVQGLKSFDRKMKALPKAVARHVHAAMERSANEIVALARQFVPVDEGDLRDSIGWTWGNVPSGSVAFMHSGKFDNARITIFAGDKKAFYAAFVEFGTKATSAHPFFFPAYRFKKKRAKRRISRAIGKGFKEIAK